MANLSISVRKNVPQNIDILNASASPDIQVVEGSPLQFIVATSALYKSSPSIPFPES
jgi:hypothetical protein